MALIKSITLDNGITVNYHRVVSVNNITNHASIIEVASYINSEKRQEEKTALENNQTMNVFIPSEYLGLLYNSTLNVNSAYEYLKTLDKFSNATSDE